LRRRGLDGSQSTVVIDSDEVSLSVAEYNPIFLRGDVAKPGSYPYRPGITVRQAVALAGGYGALQTEYSYLMVPDLRSQREVLLNEHAQKQARVARLQAERGKDTKMPEVPELSLLARDINALESEQLNSRKADFEKEKQYILGSIQSLRSNLDLLEKQMQTEEERAKIDQEEMIRVEGLVAKGMAPVGRLSDTRRIVLLSASRATEIQAHTEQVRQQRADAERKLQKLFDDREMELMKELQDAKVELAAAASRLSATTEKMILVGTAESQLRRNASVEPELIVFRKKAASGEERLIATEETELLPRDVVAVSLPFNDMILGNKTKQPREDKEQVGALPNQAKR